MPKSEKFEKENDSHIKVTTPSEPKVEVYSYDRILNEIQELTEKLARWQVLKAEADKLGLKR